MIRAITLSTLAYGALAYAHGNPDQIRLCDLDLKSQTRSLPILGPMDDRIHYRRLPEVVIANSWTQEGKRYEKTEIAEIVRVDDPETQKRIDFVHAMGGQVRFLKTKVKRTQDELGGDLPPDQFTFDHWQKESPYYWVNEGPEVGFYIEGFAEQTPENRVPRVDIHSESHLLPVIGIDLSGDRALASLDHEITHLIDWMKTFHEALADGLDWKRAVLYTNKIVWLPHEIVAGEQRAIAAEMKTEREYRDNIFNQQHGHPRPYETWHRYYVNRITYPEYQAVRNILRSKWDEMSDQDKADLRRYLKSMVLQADEFRRAALEHLEFESDLYHYWRGASIEKLLLAPNGESRLISDGNLDRFKFHLREVCREVLTVPGQCE